MREFGKLLFAIVCFSILSLISGCEREIDEVVSPPIDVSAIPPTPSDLSAEIGDGLIFLSWNISDSSLVAGYNIYQADSVTWEYALIGSSQVESFTASELQNGLLYSFRVSAVNSEGYEGYRSEPVSAIPEVYSVLINGGEEYTNIRDVTLAFTAPANTRFMQISADSSFAGSQWETFVSSRDYFLSGGDGIKAVYCRFRDIDDRVTWRFYSDSIALDTKANIDSVMFTPAGPFSPGESIHFKLYTIEPGGGATISIGSDFSVIILFDDGQRGDMVADDGIYELEYTIPEFFDFEDEIVTGEFTDRAGNTAMAVQADDRLSVRRPPEAVSIFNINAPQGYHDRLNLNWDQSEAHDFAQYRIYRSLNPEVDSTDLLAAVILSIEENSLSDTGLIANTAYYYRVYVVDNTGLWSGSNEVNATTGMDDPPQPVDLYPIITEPDFYQEIEIAYSQSPDGDFESYRLYRWQESQGRSDSVLAAIITDRDNTTLTDHPPFHMSPDSADTMNFWYIIHVYDIAGNSSPSDSVRAHLVDATPPQVSGSVSPSDSSLIIAWSQSSIPDFGSYHLIRDTDSNPSGALPVYITVNIATISFEDDSTLEGQTYYYWLEVFDIRGNKSQTALGSGVW
jgi:fibronectin type 3 domain-containing protein